MVTIAHGKCIRGVRMERNCHIVIVRHVQSRVGTCVCRSGIRRDHQQTGVLIRRINGTYRFHEIVVQLVDYFIAFRVALPFVGNSGLSRFVHALEDQMLVVVLEVGGDLYPHLLQPFGHFLISSGKVRTIDPLLVVQIQNDIHILIIGVVHYFLDTLQPLLADRVNRLAVFVSSRCDILIPCGGNTNGVESLCLDGVDQFLRNSGIAPAGFTAVSGGIQRVANVPADRHVFRNIIGGHGSLSGSGCLEKCHAGKQHDCGSTGSK